ncbi:MAG: hypothetical protein KC684_05905 [Candidatus Omnitrophica bacterium]|nr:hypothetical protein [Candidatus Omnitrophota bacterium]
MRKLINIFIILICVVVVCSGCNNRRKQQQALREELKNEPLIEMIDSTELAKIILKPERPDLRIKRDPFTPLNAKIPEEGEDPLMFEQNIEDLLQSIKYYGYVKVNQEYSALLIINEEKGVFNINDTVKELTISDINQDYIVFKNADNARTYKLQRGEK